MNPYDFVRIDWNQRPDRRQPIWHHRLVGPGGKQLYSGSLEVDVDVEKPLFISDPRAVPQDPRRPARSIQNKQGKYIIPGSSLKGMLRTVVEALGNGCLTLFDGQYERGKVDYKPLVQPFQRCSSNTDLCIACRTFGMLGMRAQQGVFLGKVNIGDAVVDAGKVYEYEPLYTKPLMEPKPHHDDFYLDPAKKHIAGRKFYFHHAPDAELVTDRELRFFGGRPANRYILPLDYGTRFHFSIDFTNLEGDEFGALLFAVALEQDMRHKIGYAKPLGLGSIQLTPTRLTLVDYSTRYMSAGKGAGKTVLQGNDMWNAIYEQMDNFEKNHLVQIAMQDLRRIWQWEPDPNVDYYYPSKRDWFNTPDSRGKRIADTRNVP